MSEVPLQPRDISSKGLQQPVSVRPTPKKLFRQSADRFTHPVVCRVQGYLALERPPPPSLGPP